MNLLDENILESQRQKLLAWHIKVKQIGHEVGRPGMADLEEIIPLLYRLRRVTLFTRDLGFYKREFRHAAYGLVCLQVGKEEAAEYIRRLLRHPKFNTQVKRLGRVIRVSGQGVRYWQLSTEAEQRATWPETH